MDFIDDAQEGDTTTLLIIAGAILIITSFACLICNSRRKKKIVKGCWRLAAEGYGRKLSTANAAFQGAYDVRIDPSVISSVCQSADAAYRTRNSAALSPDAPIGPASGAVKHDPNELRRQICEWPAIYAPIADIALNVFSDFSRTLAKDGFLVHFDSEELGARGDCEHPTGAAGPADSSELPPNGLKHPVDPSTRKQRLRALSSGPCWRCCCVCPGMEESALDNAEDVLANLVAKAFLTHLGKRATHMAIRFAARGWVHPSLISVAKAVEQRLANGGGGGGDGEEGLDHELGELSPTDGGRERHHRAVVLACSPREDAADAEERFVGSDMSSDLYLRTCVDLSAFDGAFGNSDDDDDANPAVKVAKAVRLRADLVEFLTALQTAIDETAAPDSLKLQHWMYRGVDAVDRNLSAALYRRRCRELQTALGHWEAGVVSALEGMLASSTDALKLQAIEGPDLSRRPSAVIGEAAEVGSPSRVTDHQLRRFLDDFFERAEAQYSAAFTRDADHDDHGTVAACCGNCLPELPHVRRIKSGEDVLREHLIQRVTAAAAKEFAVAPAHREYAARLLSELKADALNRITGGPSVSDDDSDDAAADVGEEDVSLEWSDDGNGNGDDATPGSASRRRRRRRRFAGGGGDDADGPASPLPGEPYSLPDIAYEWLPRHLVPTLGAQWSDAVDAVTHRVSERTMGGIAKLEDELSVLVASRDAGFSRMEAEVIDAVRDAAAPHIRELAHAATVLKTICRFSRDACITARQGAVHQLTRVLMDLREFLESVLNRPAMEDYRSWLPLGQIVRSFNVHAAKCPQATPIAGAELAGIDASGGAGDDVAPTPPPRSDI